MSLIPDLITHDSVPSTVSREDRFDYNYYDIYHLTGMVELTQPPQTINCSSGLEANI